MQQQDYYDFSFDTEASSTSSQFVTDNNLAYTIGIEPDAYGSAFQDCDQLSSNGWGLILYMRSFNPETDTNKLAHDEKVAVTIRKIVDVFLKEHPEAVLIYNCDSNDNRHGARQALFTKWAKAENGIAKCQHLKIEIVQPQDDGSELSHYYGCFVKTDNPKLNEIELEFNLFVESFFASRS